MRQEEIDRLEQACEQLPEDYRRVLTLTRIAGLSHEEAGREMGRTAGASRKLLNRAIVQLTGILAGDPS